MSKEKKLRKLLKKTKRNIGADGWFQLFYFFLPFKLLFSDKLKVISSVILGNSSNYLVVLAIPAISFL